MTGIVCPKCGYLPKLMNYDGILVWHPGGDTYKNDVTAVIKVGCSPCSLVWNIPLDRHQAKELASQLFAGL